MVRGRPTNTTEQAAELTNQAVDLAESAAKALYIAQYLQIKTKVVEKFPLTKGEWATIAEFPGFPAKLKRKLAKKDAAFTFAETANIVMIIAETFPLVEPKKQVALLLIAKKLTGFLQANLHKSNLPTKTRKPKSADLLYQFKITLKESRSPIWRRIQVKDCTLDKMHEHIQTAMGWTNSHLHHFKIGEQHFGDPVLLQENFNEMEYEDSTTTKLSDIIPQNGKRFQFTYEYDFGDSWYHEILFEGCPKEESGTKYPLCVEGERACPPEDCGGIWGYPDFVEAIQNPDHERHDELLEWIGGEFDPEAFDPTTATKAMKKGLPDWRNAGW